MSDDKIHIHIDSATKDPALLEFDQDFKCPKCKIAAETGFGLAGGGYGIYSYCPQCGDLLTKSETPE